MILAPTTILAYLIHRRMVNLEPFLIGASLLIVTLLVQPPLQLGVSYFIKDLESILTIILYSIVMGGIAGFLQEALKLIGLKLIGYTRLNAIGVGCGFGYAEAVLTFSGALIALFLKLSTITFEDIVLGSIERCTALIFHIVSTLILYLGFISGRTLLGYLLVSITHTIVDSSAVAIKRGLLPLEIMEATWFTIVVIMLILYLMVERELTTTSQDVVNT